MLHAISLGAGVQSSTMALMFAHGELEPMPDCAIFADTGAEPRAVYEWLDWLEARLPFPVHRVMEGEGLRRNIIDSVEGGRFAGAPFFTEHRVQCPCTDDGRRPPKPSCIGCSGTGLAVDARRERAGQLRRQCTREFKVQPITRKVRELAGLAKGERAPREILVTQYIGISLDEAIRMKPSRDHWIEHQWPLVERGMRRLDCLEWMERQGYPQPPRSACTFCPYHSDAEWKALRESPKDWQDVIEMDRLIRGGVRGTKDPLYLHRSLKPLDEINFDSAEDRGQGVLFGDECEGLCGV